MRKNKTIKIDDKEITVKELTVRQIWQMARPDDKQKGKKADGTVTDQGAEIFDRIDQLLSLTCSGIDRGGLMDLAPSEITVLWNVFKEVNSDFLDLIKRLGLDALVMAEVQKNLATLTGPSPA